MSSESFSDGTLGVWPLRKLASIPSKRIWPNDLQSGASVWKLHGECTPRYRLSAFYPMS